MTLIGANALKELGKKELRVLVATEVGMKNSQYVDIEDIAKFAGYGKDETERRLKTCHKFNLVHRWTGHFVGYELTIHGYDTLALNALYEEGKITSIGREKGVGKESKVYYALTSAEQEVILKFHRVGYTSFHQVKKKRRYTANKHHISELYSSRLSAESEKKWLELANKLNLPVPKIYGSNRHILILELIDGIDLSKLSDLPDPEETLEQILDFIDIAWNKGKFVHGDLSEHNIIMTHDANPIVIDFPQAVSNTFKEAENMLVRDISNILTYFQRKHGLSYDANVIYSKITGKSI